MISRICARLIIISGIVGLAQVQAGAQAVLNAAQSQFGTEPAPYAQPAQPVTAERAIPVNQAGGAYAPASSSYAPGGSSYAPAAAPAGAYAPGGAYPPAESAALGAPDPSKPLGRGDTVTFAIIQDREPPQLMRVTDTGELDFSAFPKIGRISVVGRNCAQVASDLKRRLEADYYYTADVALGINQVNLTASRGKVYITGNVRMPGPQDLPSNERTTVINAIIRAGGFDKFANEHKVQITRKDKSGQTIRFNVDVQAIIEKGRLDKDIELQEGDYINVPQNIINF